jgi:hypothetical protein
MRVTAQEKITYIPDPPTPHKARPTIKALIVGAPPHNADPASNSVTHTIYVHLALNWPNTFPHTRFVAAAPIKNATLSQLSLPTSLKCVTMTGCTSATIVLSSANRKVEDKMERTTTIHFHPEMSRGGTSSAVSTSCFSVSVSWPVIEVFSDVSCVSLLGAERKSFLLSVEVMPSSLSAPEIGRSSFSDMISYGFLEKVLAVVVDSENKVMAERLRLREEDVVLSSETGPERLVIREKKQSLDAEETSI